ncbi:TIGR03747 family integrating conjugative element membrane protein [Vibrio rotiferianus]|uniref:TIGR03747 family integrating conjugative element membrane protein n=1 Tax=Vibrio rotiferianus TaxID=190895 RepID=UPI0005EDD698|nr:TIGR03747 family integrating conjugative element membrane protein [Vibrio rotiferianus]
MAQKSHQEQGRDRAQNAKLSTRIVNWVLGIPVAILITLIFSIVVEWVGMNLIWQDEGVNHSKAMFISEARYLNKHFQDSLIGSSPVRFIGFTIKVIDDEVFKPIGMGWYKNRTYRGWRKVVWQHVVSAYYISKVVVLRVLVLLFSIPAYLLFGVVGIVTGLVERDLRRFGAGRESSDRYELARKLVFPSVSLCFILYLSWPNSINPALIVVPFAAAFGWALHLTFSNYKKYL